MWQSILWYYSSFWERYISFHQMTYSGVRYWQKSFIFRNILPIYKRKIHKKIRVKSFIQIKTTRILDQIILCAFSCILIDVDGDVVPYIYSYVCNILSRGTRILKTAFTITFSTPRKLYMTFTFSLSLSLSFLLSFTLTNTHHAPLTFI